ncbi:hypothetical protein H4219_004024 [Mycoemilia scoparia]|uniref:Uncharacterized protein n=1 Tax=Mycoemilia scoparia TaxID=417184 RepID=A0A9W7ZYT0_9FUNG|nr:hypothetical protein H4219_004024 [Mycoemilia scoparia]
MMPCHIDLTRQHYSSFSMDPSFKGRAQPYIAAIKALSVVSLFGFLGVGFYYYGTHLYIEKFVLPTPDMLEYDTRRILRAATYREQLAENPRSAYTFLQMALDQIIENGQLGPTSLVVQDINYRMAYAAFKQGEIDKAKELTEICLRALKQPADYDSKVDDKMRLEIFKQQQSIQVNLLAYELGMTGGVYNNGQESIAEVLPAIEKLEDMVSLWSKLDGNGIRDPMPYIPVWSKDKLLLEKTRAMIIFSRETLKSGNIADSDALLTLAWKVSQQNQPQNAEKSWLKNIFDTATYIEKEKRCNDALILAELSVTKLLQKSADTALKLAEKGYEISTERVSESADVNTDYRGEAQCLACTPLLLFTMGNIFELEPRGEQKALLYYKRALRWTYRGDYISGVPKARQLVSGHSIESRIEKLTKASDR